MQVRIWELEQEIEETLNSLDTEDFFTPKQNLKIAKLHELRETLERLKQTYKRFIEKQKQQDS